MELLKLDEGITFGTRGTIARFSGRGWSLQESQADLTWNAEPQADLNFRCMVPRSDIVARLDVMPFLGEGRVRSQSILVFLNGAFCAYQIVAGPRVLEVLLRKETFLSKGNTLSLAFPNATSPIELGINQDQRTLAFAFRSMQFAEE